MRALLYPSPHHTRCNWVYLWVKVCRECNNGELYMSTNACENKGIGSSRFTPLITHNATLILLFSSEPFMIVAQLIKSYFLSYARRDTLHVDYQAYSATFNDIKIGLFGKRQHIRNLLFSLSFPSEPWEDLTLEWKFLLQRTATPWSD